MCHLMISKEWDSGLWLCCFNAKSICRSQGHCGPGKGPVLRKGMCGGFFCLSLPSRIVFEKRNSINSTGPVNNPLSRIRDSDWRSHHTYSCLNIRSLFPACTLTCWNSCFSPPSRPPLLHLPPSTQFFGSPHIFLKWTLQGPSIKLKWGNNGWTDFSTWIRKFWFLA